MLCVIEDTFPECEDRAAYVVDVDVRHVFVEKQFKCDSGAARVRFNIFPVEEMVCLN